MLVAFDVDGVLDLDPADFASMMNALKAAGHRVAILTGASDKHPTPQDLKDKANYLSELGMAHCWDELVVFGDPPHKAKAKWCRKHNVSILVDNSAENADLADESCVVLVPWNSMIDAPKKVVHDAGT